MKKTFLFAFASAALVASAASFANCSAPIIDPAQANACPADMVPVTVDKRALIILNASNPDGGTAEQCALDLYDTTRCYTKGDEITLSYPDLSNWFNTNDWLSFDGKLHTMSEVKYRVDGQGLEIKAEQQDIFVKFSCHTIDSFVDGRPVPGPDCVS